MPRDPFTFGFGLYGQAACVAELQRLRDWPTALMARPALSSSCSAIGLRLSRSALDGIATARVAQDICPCRVNDVVGSIKLTTQIVCQLERILAEEVARPHLAWLGLDPLAPHGARAARKLHLQQPAVRERLARQTDRAFPRFLDYHGRRVSLIDTGAHAAAGQVQASSPDLLCRQHGDDILNRDITEETMTQTISAASALRP